MTHKQVLENAHLMKVISITGGLGTGKTCLAYCFLEAVKKHKPVYIYRHPNPTLIASRGYLSLYELGEIENLQDCGIWIDEPQLFISRTEKKSNIALERLMTLARQRNITLVLSTADTRFITRGISYYVDSWAILDINVALVKQGSVISKIIKKNALITAQQWRLPLGKYLFDSREFYKFNGKKSFSKPRWYNETFSKPFREG